MSFYIEGGFKNWKSTKDYKQASTNWRKEIKKKLWIINNWLS